MRLDYSYRNLYHAGPLPSLQAQGRGIVTNSFGCATRALDDISEIVASSSASIIHCIILDSSSEGVFRLPSLILELQSPLSGYPEDYFSLILFLLSSEDVRAIGADINPPHGLQRCSSLYMWPARVSRASRSTGSIHHAVDLVIAPKQ
jgi:hypothetical protein